MAFTRDQLMEQVWGMDYCGETRTVDMHIRTLRQKLGEQRRAHRDCPRRGLPMGGGEDIDQKDLPLHSHRRRRCARCASLVLVMGCFYSYLSTGMQEHQLGDELRHRRQQPWRPTARPIWRESSPTATASPGSPPTAPCSTTRRRTPRRWRTTLSERRSARRWRPARAARAATAATLLQKTDLQREAASRTAPCCASPPSRATMRRAAARYAFQPILLVVIVLLVLSSLLAEPSGQAHRRAAQRARPRASAGKRRL